MDHTTNSRVEEAVDPRTRITLVSKPGCHLCRLARDVIQRVADDLDVTWTETSITELTDPDPLWWEQIPITFVDGRQHDYWRVSESRLRAALGAPRVRASA